MLGPPPTSPHGSHVAICPETQRWVALQIFQEMYIQCEGTAILILFFSNVADDWIKKESTVQVRLPSASSMVPGTTRQARVRGTTRRMLECRLQLVEMVCAITELQYTAALSGYRDHRQSHVSSALEPLISRPRKVAQRKGRI